jgi:nucleoid-associated protein YgaU
MKKILPLIGMMILTTSCGLIMSEEDGAEKPQDGAVTEFKVTEGQAEKAPAEKVVEAEKPQEQVAVAEQAPASDIVVDVPAPPAEETKVEAIAMEPAKEEMRAPVEPRHEEFVKKAVAEVPAPAPVMAPQEFGQYKISKDETLMMAAFRIYGDYRKWKELKSWNKDALKHGIHTGLSLKYYVPEKKFVWQPAGLPYLVKEGNTLGSISQDKYGTHKKWKDLYENNRPLIINPNVIFAGFTIYYVPTRGIASQKK